MKERSFIILVILTFAFGFSIRETFLRDHPINAFAHDETLFQDHCDGKDETYSSISSKKLRILHLTDLKTHQSIMDRWFARSHKAFAINQELVADAVLWGMGFPGYDPEKTLTQNIDARYGRTDYFDAILPYYNMDQWWKFAIDPTPWFAQIKELSSHGTIVIDRPHEMRDFRRSPFLEGVSRVFPT